MMDYLQERMCDYIERRGLFVEGAPLVVMVSGGGDSVAMLRLLATEEVRERVHYGALTVLHINHLFNFIKFISKRT